MCYVGIMFPDSLLTTSKSAYRSENGTLIVRGRLRTEPFGASHGLGLFEVVLEQNPSGLVTV